MARDRMWTYRVEMTVAGQRWTHSEWRVRSTRLTGRGHGKPTDANLACYVADMVASHLPGGANERCGRDLGIPDVRTARIIDQRTGEVVATYQAPARPAFVMT